MHTIDFLRNSTSYPVPEGTLESILERRGLSRDHEMDNSAVGILCLADLYRWHVTAPNVSQGGQSYTLTEETRKCFLEWSNEIYKMQGEPQRVMNGKTQYGYKGEKL